MSALTIEPRKRLAAPQLCACCRPVRSASYTAYWLDYKFAATPLCSNCVKEWEQAYADLEAVAA